MKHILFGLAAVLFASSVALADSLIPTGLSLFCGG